MIRQATKAEIDQVAAYVKDNVVSENVHRALVALFAPKGLPLADTVAVGVEAIVRAVMSVRPEMRAAVVEYSGIAVCQLVEEREKKDIAAQAAAAAAAAAKRPTVEGWGNA